MYQSIDMKMLRLGRVVLDRLPLDAYKKARLKSWIKSALASVKYRSLYLNQHTAERIIAPTSAASQHIPHPMRRSRTSFPSSVVGPEVSIVIPVYNNLEYTLRCIEAITRHTHDVAYEIIVVDDCSDDQTYGELAGRRDIRYLRNAVNRGFVASSNMGAKVATGEFVVMLNNDTEVMTNWLLELRDTFHYCANAGLVGAKLIYPDGTLQEAGGILWRDGSAWNYGRGDDPHKPEYNYLRETDYISGACIMLPRKLWEQLGGFDTHFAPAYGEDSDLAFRVRAAGHRVYYQPMAQVIHYEGVSCGTDLTSGLKAYQIENAEKLYERWKPVLTTHRPNGQQPELEKERDVTKRLLVVDAITPMPDHDAGSITAMGILELGQELGYKVSFIPESNFTWIPGYSDALARIGIESVVWPSYRGVKAFLSKRGQEFDAVLLFRGGIAAQYMDLVRKLAPQARLAFHASDLHFLREEREAMLTNSRASRQQAEQTRELETEVVASVDCTIVHSAEEQKILEDLVPNAKVVLFPWMIDVKRSLAGFEPRRDMMYIGGYRHPPNVDAVEYFVGEIWPEVRQKLPDARFFIVGSNAPDMFDKLVGNGVELIGYVESLDQLMDHCRMTVVPLRFGAGIKGKIGTSMSYGVPVVTTSIGAEGMLLTDGSDILIADDPKAFAEAVVRLYTDSALWETVSRASTDYVERMYSRRKGQEIMSRVLQPEHSA